MQAPYFEGRGLDLCGYYPGTLNLSLAPHRFVVGKPDYHFKDVHWADGFPPEDFLFVRCEIEYRGTTYPALIYYPDPATKIGHFQEDATLEVLAGFIDGLGYGDSVTILLDSDKVQVY